jgi:hypothetical protein
MDWPSHYSHFPKLTAHAADVRIRPLHWQDREPIRVWRNEQIDVLRQTHELSPQQQDDYYRNVILPQFAQPSPAQILWAMEESDQLMGYGGLVHIHWPDLRAEVSFLSATPRNPTKLEDDWSAFLTLLIPIARDRLGLHKLTTETYRTRPVLVPILEAHGFRLEGELREHHRISDEWVDSLAHGLLLN